jgi:DNA-binding NtrC family response regulator
MPDNAVVYGKVVGSDVRRDVEKQACDTILWKDDPTLFPVNGAGSLVFVDLDDPRFDSPDFLVSLATAGRKAKIIGKRDQQEPADALHYSRLGVSELLSPAQCLARLQDFLDDIENASSGPPAESQRPPRRYSVEALVGVSEQVNDLREVIRVLSEVDFPSALILGETGTGKSLVCKVLHNNGQRAHHNLVEVNCSAVPDELFESELFGHAKGAFTGADTDKQGLFEYAQSGTMFLDEVGNLSPSAQAKLLKVLEDKKLRRVGAVSETDINVRVVAATNLDLSEAIEDGHFREDLFYRLNLLTIEIPPLRERPEDIPILVDHFRRYYATMYAKPEVAFSSSAVETMSAYHWPGNVRELCNVIERAVLLSKGDAIEPQDIKLALKSGRMTIADRRQLVIDIPPQGVTLDQVEQQVVKHVLNLHNWNKSETARYLGISRPRLRRLIENAGLEQNRRQK